jgi:hypothetical protein
MKDPAITRVVAGGGEGRGRLSVGVRLEQVVQQRHNRRVGLAVQDDRAWPGQGQRFGGATAEAHLHDEVVALTQGDIL